MLDSGHKLQDAFDMGIAADHHHFFYFQSADREWHKLRHTWDERKQEREKREKAEKDMYRQKLIQTKPVKREEAQSKKTESSFYDPGRYSGRPRRIRRFARGAFVTYQGTLWKILNANHTSGKYDLISPDYAPRSGIDGMQLKLSPAPESPRKFQMKLDMDKLNVF
eukprot:g5721.t1